MSEEIKKLTVLQAGEKGYTHFIEDGGETAVKFSDLAPDDVEYYKRNKCWAMDMITPKHYTISANDLKNIVTNFVEDQDEMADEDEKLTKITESHDYSFLAEELNKRFEAITYYAPTDIEIIF